MAGMAKCPLSYECGQEYVIINEGESKSFTIQNVSVGTVCIYTIYASLDNGTQEYLFNVLESKPNSYIGGVFSNRKMKRD